MARASTKQNKNIYLIIEVITIYKEFIKNNIHKLTKEHIYLYALKNNIKLCPKETEIIYNFIKENYNELLNKNTNILNQLQPYLRLELFNKIIQLYNDYIPYLD